MSAQLSHAARIFDQHRSMANWVISLFCTQCGQPHRICPCRSSTRSCGSGLGSRMTSQSAISRERGNNPATSGAEPLVGHAEAFAVALFEKDVLAQVGIDPLDVLRVDRQPPLILLVRP